MVLFALGDESTFLCPESENLDVRCSSISRESHVEHVRRFGDFVEEKE